MQTDTKDNSQGYSNKFLEIDDVPLDEALMPPQDPMGRVSHWQITQRNIDTRSGNIVQRDANNQNRLFIGFQQGGF